MSSRKFILNSTELGRATLVDDPIGWDAVKRVFTRNLKYVGVFRKRTANMKFIGDGLTYCHNLFVLKGTEAVLNIIIMQKKDYEDAWEVEFEGIGKFNPFDLEWDDDLSPSVTIEFEDSGFHNKFLTRASMDFNIGEQLSVEGVDMGAMPTKSIQVHQRAIQENNFFILSANDKYYGGFLSLPPEFIFAEFGHVLPAEKTEGDTDFIQTPTDYALTSPGLMVDFVTQRTAVRIKTHIVGLVESGDPIEWSIRKFTDDTDLSIYVDTVLHSEAPVPPFDPININFDITTDIQLEVGEALSVVCFVPNVGAPINYSVDYSLCDINVAIIQNFDEYVSNCHFRFEFMKRLVQLMTDQEDCFKSNTFGRTALGYVENGEFWNNVCFNGNQLRGFNDKFPVRSFEKSFQSARAIFNVGCGIEKFGGGYKVVVETLPHFFRGDISITLHNVRKVKRKNNEQFTFSEIRVGYEKSEYEEVNGLEEYNNKSVYATFIKSDSNILDLISPDRADGYGMEFARRKSIKNALSEDTSYDNEVFTAMVNEEPSGLLRTQKDENYSSVLNIQSPETATNLDITPQRNLLRNGDWIQGCCYKFPTEKLKHISADRETDLETTRIGDAGAVTEQTSIDNGDLLSSLWLNLNYVFEADITPAQVAAMELKPNSLIKFSPFSREMTTKYYYGWVMEASVGGKEREGTFTLLAANINSERLHLIDPDGIFDGDPTTPLPPGPPGDTEFGYEYAFDKLFEA